MRRATYISESLERRLLLATAPAAIISQYHGKLETQLWQNLQNSSQPTAPSNQPSQLHYDLAGNVQVDLHVTGKLNAAIDSLGKLGVQIGSTDPASGIVEVWSPPGALATISALSAVRSIDTPDYRVVRAGTVTSAGDSILEADKVRSDFAAYGIDGTGVKVGVISDGADDRNNVGSDLPTVTVNPALPGDGDEGTAMMEIVHDLAPGAQLYFSGPETDIDMVSSINWMVSQGCKVIVDDLGFYGESFFADGPIAQAAESAISAGVVYVSAAGNESETVGEVGDFHYDHEFVDDGSTQNFNNFNPTGTKDDFMDFDVLGDATVDVILQWSDPFGASSNDYDLYLYAQNHRTILAESDDSQTGTQDPIESLEYTNSSSSTQKLAIAIEKFSGATRELQLFVLGDAEPLEYVTPAGSIIGQPAATGVISVGAISAADAGNDNVEYYSSQGPTVIYTDFTAQTRTLRNSLTGDAIDGVQTHVGQLGDFENPFYGTSAAAPDAAAIAALMLDASPSLTPAQVKQSMQNTAIDLTAYGVGYDQVSGSGRFDALGAVYNVFVPSAPAMTAASDLGVSSSDDLTSDNTPTFTGSVPAGAYVTLYVDGVANASVQLAAGVTTYNLTATALSNGPHNISIRVAGSSATSVANFSNPSGNLPIVIDTAAPTITPLGFSYEHGPSISYLISADVSATLSAGALSLQNQSATALPPTTPSAVSITPSQGQYLATFNLAGLPDGNYSATLNTSHVTDAAGNALIAPAATSFFILTGDANHDRVVNAQDFAVLAAHYGQTNADYSDGDFNGDGVVNALDFDLLAEHFNAQLPPPATVGAPDLFGAQTITPDSQMGLSEKV